MFKRSRNYALIALPIAVVAIVIVAMSADPTDPNPKVTLAAIFGILGLFFIGLFIVQGRDLNRAAAVPTAGTDEIGRPLANPMTASEPELWAALAIEPIGDDAARARGDGWQMARDSMAAGRIIVALIFIAVPLTYLLESFIPILIGAPIIVGYALYRSYRVLGSGGDLDRGYDAVARSIAPLGLELVERPKVSAGPRVAPAPGMRTYINGALSFAGKRHGRLVEVTLADGGCRVYVAARGPEFTARSSDGKLRNKDGLPPEIERALADVPASTGWRNMSAKGDASGIHIARSKITDQREWLCDLWLAERLADAVA